MSQSYPAIPPPPKTPPPHPFPIEKGLPWKAILWALGLLGAAVIPSVTVVYEVGVVAERLDSIRADVSGMRTQHEEVRLQVAALQVKSTSHEMELARLRDRMEKLREIREATR